MLAIAGMGMCEKGDKRIPRGSLYYKDQLNSSRAAAGAERHAEGLLQGNGVTEGTIFFGDVITNNHSG